MMNNPKRIAMNILAALKRRLAALRSDRGGQPELAQGSEIPADVDVNAAALDEVEKRSVWRVRFVVLSRPDTHFELDISDEIILGRATPSGGDTVDLTPYDALELFVSRRHLILRPSSTGLYAIDAASHNGTQRNGHSLVVNQPYLLNDSDRLTLGQLQLEIHILGRPAPVPVNSTIIKQPTVRSAYGLLQPGDILNNRYRILGIIDDWGLGVVYQAYDLISPESTRLCAIKTMNIDYQHERETFERVVKILATLNHPGIARIYDYFDSGNDACLVMEFIQGHDLGTILRTTDDNLPVEQVLQWGIKVCDILSYLHTCQPEPIALCGIKPSSVMINDDKHVRLIGFGPTNRIDEWLWKKELDYARPLNTSGYFFMSQHRGGYFSPEQRYEGITTPAGDIYALGAILHHLLTRRDPCLAAAFSFHDKPLSTYNSAVPDALAAVVMRALSYAPEDRYASAEEMKQALHGFDRPASAPTEPTIVIRSSTRVSIEPLQPGQVMQNRYRTLGILGIGGAGAVYLARDLAYLNETKLCAVKEMINMAQDQQLREQTIRNFESESQILARLDHPAIPQIYDYFSFSDRAYLVMEFIQGKDLEAILHSTDSFLPVEPLRQWGVEICEVLTYLHNHQPEPIVLRDMKPNHVMIDHHKRVRLINFGTNKIFVVGQPGTMIGTEGYSAPEQYKGIASPASDMYALGATLHHLLTRRDPRLEPPFTFDQKPISKYNPAVPDALAAVVMRALNYDPAKRYQSAEQMRQALIESG